MINPGENHGKSFYSIPAFPYRTPELVNICSE
jgi:hypothetical protein